MDEMVCLVSQARKLLYDYNRDILNTFMDKTENILIIELFLNKYNIIHSNKSSRRKQKQNAKQFNQGKFKLLQYDPAHQKLWAVLPNFTDLFSKKNAIKMKPLDQRDFNWQNDEKCDQFVIYTHQFQRNCWLFLEKKMWAA